MSAILKDVKKPTKVRPLGASIDALWQLREEKRAAEAIVKGIELKIADAETEVFASMDAQGVIKSTGTKATVSIGESTSFNIEDFDALTKYIAKTKYFHLLQRRVSEVAVREIFESKGAVPGLTPFTKRKLNLLTVK